MTAFKDAFEKAGMNTAGAELFKLATAALKNHGGNPDKAAGKFCTLLRKRNDLLTALALEFLRRVATDMAATPSTKDVPVRDYKTRAHKRQRPRTDSERAGALVAAATAAKAMGNIFDERRIDDRAIGDFSWGELLTAIHSEAHLAASYLRQGTQATANALLLDKIEAFAQVADHTTKIRDVLTATDLARLDQEATREAPHVVERGMKLFIATVEERQNRITS